MSEPHDEDPAERDAADRRDDPVDDDPNARRTDAPREWADLADPGEDRASGPGQSSQNPVPGDAIPGASPVAPEEDQAVRDRAEHLRRKDA